jgi:1-deoxy-D-xylulose-5-phosphate reductoisomerase
MCVFSAANEVAVAAFLAGEIRFTDIDRVIDSALRSVDLAEPQTLDAVQMLDQLARDHARAVVSAQVSAGAA